MDITLYNTLSRTEEKFIPIQKNKVSMYHCGPTIYNTPHIGNLRTPVFADLLRRTFEFNGYDVIQVMNLTDVDDKTIKGSQAEGISLFDFTARYEKIFLDNIKALNVLTPSYLPRATEYMREMIELIENLLKKGVAYEGAEGVYFSVEKSKKYGELAKLKMDHISASTTTDEYDKEHVSDFALWKFAKPEDGDNVWDAPFGKGRPGWHIECSAMSLSILGDTFDIHTGGEDLIFPHHTNEIAQSEAATGKPFVHYWLHTGFINIEGEKMAKSKGNFLTLADIEEEGFSALDFRYLLLTSHYRTKFDFSYDALKGASQARRKLARHVCELPENGTVQKDVIQEFKELINEDINIPEGLAFAWKTLKNENISPADIKATLLEFDKVFGLSLNTEEVFEIPELVKKLTEEREEARKTNNWAESDRLREEIKKQGFLVEDTKEGTKLSPL